MKKKIMSVLEIILVGAGAFFAGLGLMFFVDAMAIISEDSKKTEEISYNIHYCKHNLKDDMGGLLIISGNGIVLKEVVDSFEDVAAIYVSESISGIEPNAFRDVEGLKTVVMPYAIEPKDMDVPRQTDVLYIEDNEYMDFLEPYI